ncbi:MAG: ATP-binding protein [Formivibrio sp.]|nr:ATP-binding protein [Formivibrio sp.]
MSAGNPLIDPRELEQAFSLFNEASRQLSSAYAELQEQVISLTAQLEIANGALRRELDEKAVLSRRLGLLLARLPAGVAELDGAGLIIQMNPAAERLLGVEVIGTSWGALKRARFRATPESDLWCYQGDHGERWLSVVESPIPEEKISLLLIHDLTESWELQQALARHQRLAAMGEMAAGLAHQLRTPLSTALLYTGHLARPTLNDVDRYRFAGKTLDRLRYLETLIGNMLRFVRGQTHELEVVSLAELLEEAALALAHDYAQSGILLQIDVGDRDAWVRVNRKEMVGALTNLLDNARHASSFGMQVKMTLGCIDGNALVEVRDSGCGMSTEVLARLFDPFFTTRKEGTGLGLAIVRNLVTMYGGDVSADSILGAGSILRIRLPLVIPQSTV